VTARGQGMTPITMCNNNEWHLIIDAVTTKAGRQPEWKCLAGYYNVCIPSVISAESMLLFDAYIRSNRGRNETFESYLDMPAIVIDAFNALDIEFAKLLKNKEISDAHKLLTTQNNKWK
jgi:hypothetical protein